VESESIREKYGLSPSDYLAAFRAIMKLEADELKNVRFSEFHDMRRMLKGEDNHTTCVWNACDPYTTRAVHGIEGNGQISNCGRTNKDGVDFVKGDQPGFERYIALYKTPREFGGCRGCRFFLQCKGQCPGTAINQDWRNRTEHCELWEGLLSDLEAEMLARGEQPLSRSPLRPHIEKQFLEAWARGENPMIETVLARVRSSPEVRQTPSL
jgi:uncharacterized protein